MTYYVISCYDEKLNYVHSSKQLFATFEEAYNSMKERSPNVRPFQINGNYYDSENKLQYSIEAVYGG